MPLIDPVALLALLQFLVFGALVGRARGRYGIKPPAVSGHEMFERAYRVQMNTLELLVVFIPALYLAARYFAPLPAAIAGAVYLVGRIVYQQAYMRDPGRRSLGFLISMLPCMALLAAAGFGVLRAMMA
ncbi:MAG: MAPEG family protein [Burkholderiales bacterium]|nr:MAPEG family protein [Burkholderiales bacterium]